jgi:hypothetical protein
VVEKRWRKGPECNDGISNWGLKEQLHQGSKETLWGPRTNHWAGGHEVHCWVFHDDSKNECQDIVEEPATARAKEEATHSWSQRRRSTGHSQKFCPHWLEMMMVVRLDWLTPY